MENEIKVNDYVRNNQGIFIIAHINIDFDDNDCNKVCLCQNEKVAFTSIDNIKKLKHSPNLIDLIQCGDYVNEMYVYGIDDYGKRKFIDTERDLFDNKDIKTIVTKEQFESISYKIERKD